jgi:predicted DNA-binding transcriptional regulator YafY
MEKFSKILLLINMLCHRQMVTTAEIKRVCHISGRSVYRYLNAISAAHFPVIFDYKLGGYRLLTKGQNNFNNFGFDEAIILILALDLLSDRVNNDYKSIIKTMGSKIMANQEVAIETVWEGSRLTRNRRTNSEDLSQMLTGLIIRSGVQGSKRMRATLKSGLIRHIELEKAIMSFDHTWNVQANDLKNSNAFALDEINTVQSC